MLDLSVIQLRKSKRTNDIIIVTKSKMYLNLYSAPKPKVPCSLTKIWIPGAFKCFVLPGSGFMKYRK